MPNLNQVFNFQKP
uniref:Family with sequence similarity 171 member B n=1 Tax=Molossus molossus TaxID=27622 RepID=A0A7J8FRH7_MOLMO|nr:family with sequence similarity 171 member B [Molossus molossus]